MFLAHQYMDSELPWKSENKRTRFLSVLQKVGM